MQPENPNDPNDPEVKRRAQKYREGRQCRLNHPDAFFDEDLDEWVCPQCCKVVQEPNGKKQIVWIS
jgi:hypothetical protein